MQLRSHIENIQWLLLLIFMSAPQSSKGDLPTPPEVSYSIDGWLEAGAFLSLYGRQNTFNFGPTDANSAQEVHLDQFYLRANITRTLGDDLNLGLTIHNLVGTDWNNSYSYGFLDNAFRWNQIGWDLPQAFVSIEKPELNIMAGKLFTPYGFEDLQATERPLFSTGYLFNFIYPTSQTGLLMDWNPTENIVIHQGITNSPDIWIFNIAEPNYLGGFSIENSLMDTPNNFSFYMTYGKGLMRMNTIMMSGVPFMPMDLDTFTTPVLGTILLLSESWSIHLANDIDINVDLTQGTINGSRTIYSGEPGSSGSWIGAGLWLDKKVNKSLHALFRFEVLQNSNQIATGYQGTLSEATLGVAYSPAELLTLRPEIRYDRSFGSSPFLNGTSEQMFSMNLDAILHF
jgi:hypothetical protein